MKLSPAERTFLGLQFTEKNRNRDGLHLPVCQQCKHVQYPVREICHHCLSDHLNWETVDISGSVLAVSTLQHSLNPYFKEHLPWAIASIKLDCGPVVIVHIVTDEKTDIEPGSKVNVCTLADPSGQEVLVVFSEKAKGQMWHSLFKK